MSFRLLRHGEFITRRLLQTRPRFIASLSLVLLGLTFALLFSARVTYELSNADDEVLQLILQSKHHKQAAPVMLSAPETTLPSFDSAHLVEVLHRVADETKLPVDEVSYALENGSKETYSRYRVTLSVTATYPVVRQFAEHVQVQLPNVSLDSISCARDDISAVALNCDLALSAFYQKASHG